MKKTTFLAFVLALTCGAGVAVAQDAQQANQVVYVEDPSQGYLFNQFKDNWFITAEGGANILLSNGDSDRKTWDRFGPAASLYVGKWFSPIIGARAGVNFMTNKSLSDVLTDYTRPDEHMINGKYKAKYNHVGPVFDVMINLTNWWCGYHPGRIYNATFYAGAGGYWTYGRTYENGKRGPWELGHDRILAVRAGLINSFNVSKQVQLSLDLRWTPMDNHRDQQEEGWNRTSHCLQAYLGVTYLFKKREWSAPVVPVCPEPENCDALRARLEAADARIADLEAQLKACLNRPMPEPVVVEKAPLATIYYPINVSKLTRKDVNVLQAVAEVMKSNPNQKYTLTGWADNYTGNDQINTRLRKNRAAGVEKQLVKFGVPASQLNTTINAGNLCDLGEKYVALDRAVTIEEAK